ncbi:hypothetical protein ACFWJQ_18395 [Streptomyces goshikiensis]|uniref:hypothetical protein n=1 Tax=Streptomyces goshikiensis TaxID=1942 RepID=UPI002E13F2DA|nr:hypothetical protein OG224_00020 [Streptomyces goshikiensis]WSS02994.1 hypothetical protein OG224_35795 [Streptomyces goshikiensis]WSS03946.1 hypothetical protein OG224_38640 [Streptomyces goshikiensis]
MPSSLFERVRKVSDEVTDPRFRLVRDHHIHQATRRLMDEAFTTFHGADRSFIREFQTTGFSPRVLELTLFAALHEQGHVFEHTGGAPDFLIGGSDPLAIEATTSNPAQGTSLTAAFHHPPRKEHPLVPADLDDAEAEFVLQAAKALSRKIEKRSAQGHAYWQAPHVQGRPFVIALESFHHLSSLFHTVGPLANYLYGRRAVATRDDEGALVLTSEKITEHRRGGSRIPSGLFAQPEAAHLSGVIFSNSATVAKFHRIGTERGYGPQDVALLRYGGLPDPDPNADRPLEHAYVVGDYGPEERETFSEGFHLLHNPWARIPIAAGVFPGFTEHHLQDDGLMLTTTSRPDYFTSNTIVFQEPDAHTRARGYVERYLAAAAG